jgi:hypothetical protein
VETGTIAGDAIEDGTIVGKGGRAARLAKGELAALVVDYLSAHPGELGPTEPGIIAADATRTVVRVAG